MCCFANTVMCVLLFGNHNQPTVKLMNYSIIIYFDDDDDNDGYYQI